MLRWKPVLGAILVPLTVYVYSPVKEHVLKHYATRWCYSNDSSKRTVDIRIHNVSSSAALPITVRVGDVNSRIEDLKYADPWDGPRIGYLSAVRHSETLRQFDILLKRPIPLDEHTFGFSLEDIEAELKGAVLDRNVPKRHRTADLLKEMTFSNHLIWLLQCHAQPHASHPCCMERAWEEWEYLLRGIQNEEITLWKQGGLQLGFSDFHFMPSGGSNFVLGLPTGHSAWLEVQYGFEPVYSPDLHTAEGPLLMVDNEDDLDRNVLIMLFRYPQAEYFIEGAIVLLALVTIPLWLPVKYLNTHTLVNRACGKGTRLDTATEWEEVYGRIKFSLRENFDSCRAHLGKGPSTLSTDAVFDFLRARLLLAYNGGLGKFQTEQQLAVEINGSMRDLAAQ